VNLLRTNMETSRMRKRVRLSPVHMKVLHVD
jgi:hypothetical protein